MEHDELEQREQVDATLVDAAAERAVLGGLMLADGQTVLWEVLATLRPGDFHDVRLGRIYEVIVALAHEGAAIDELVVGDALVRGHEDGMPRVDPIVLHALTAETPTGSNADHYARIVSDLAKRRRLATVGESIARLKRAPEGVEELIESARAMLDEVSTKTVGTLQRLGTHERVSAMVQSLEEHDEVMHATPWLALDQYIGGFRPGKVYVVAARTNVGKSAIALQIARTLAEHGPVAFVSMEMDPNEILRRLVSQVGSVSSNALEKQQLTDTDWRSFAHATPYIADLALYVRDDLDTLMEVMSFARTVWRKGEMQALVVDYLQLLQVEGKFRERRLEIDAMMRAFKKLAQRLRIPVILLAQLRRVDDSRKGKAAEPKLEDLKESGSIEQDADVVLLLHREAPKGAVLKVLVAKNRSGERGDFELKWEGPFVRAVPKVWSPSALLDEEGLTNGE